MLNSKTFCHRCSVPNEGYITVFFFFLIYDGGGIEYFVWKMQILLVCQYSFVYSKEKVYKKRQKKSKHLIGIPMLGIELGPFV